MNDKEVKADAAGSFSAVVPLEAGENKLTVRVKDAGGKEASRELFVTRQAKVYPPPSVSVTSPAEPKETVPYETDKVTVKGAISGGEGISKLTVNEKEVKADGSGGFSTDVPLETGENRVVVRVKDAGGKDASRELFVTRLAKVYPPPSLNMTSPSESKQIVPFETGHLNVKGAVSGGEGIPKVTVNEKEVKTDSGGVFSITFPLIVGDNRIAVKVGDAAGREDAKSFVVLRRHDETLPPTLEVRTPTEMSDDGKVLMSGTVNGGKGDLKLIIDGKLVPIGEAGTFSTAVALRSGKNRILLRVEDAAGRHDSQVWFLFNYPVPAK